MTFDSDDYGMGESDDEIGDDESEKGKFWAYLKKYLC